MVFLRRLIDSLQFLGRVTRRLLVLGAIGASGLRRSGVRLDRLTYPREDDAVVDQLRKLIFLALVKDRVACS